MTEQKITVTIEQNEKKSVITLTPNAAGGMDVKTEWFPSMDKEKPQGKDLLTFQILNMLRGK